MCGRYTLYHDEEDLTELFALDTFPWTARYNLAPTQQVPIVRAAGESGRHERLDARWGLVPGWVEDPATFRTLLFNARSETVAEKPAFRDAARRRRCALPASGFYEWHRSPDGTKQPYYIHRRDGAPLVFAGLYAQRTDGEPACSATILTTVPNGLIQALHDRMPVLLDAAGLERWLDPGNRDPSTLVDLLRPAADDLLDAYPVGVAVGNARVDDPGLVRRA